MIEVLGQTAASINFSMTKKDGSAWTNVTNNYACTVYMSGTIVLRWT